MFSAESLIKNMDHVPLSVILMKEKEKKRNTVFYLIHAWSDGWCSNENHIRSELCRPQDLQRLQTNTNKSLLTSCDSWLI